MIPDLEKQMKDGLERASLKEWMPGFDTEQEWQHLAQKMQPDKKWQMKYTWRYAAAVLVLISGGWIAWMFYDKPAQSLVTNQPAFKNETWATAFMMQDDNYRHLADTAINEAPATVAKKSSTRKDNTQRYATRDIISNGTPCPIEISINQTMKCPDKQPAAISSCSTLAPGEAVELNYQAHEHIARNCSLTIKEIEIKSIATGETILLTENSSPSTAQEVFSFITGQTKGDILAGMFHTDCNKRAGKRNVRLENRDGRVIIQ